MYVAVVPVTLVALSAGRTHVTGRLITAASLARSLDPLPTADS